LGLSRVRSPAEHQKNKEEHDAEPACDFEIKHRGDLHRVLGDDTRKAHHGVKLF